jgi:hypothetical protein
MTGNSFIKTQNSTQNHYHYRRRQQLLQESCLVYQKEMLVATSRCIQLQASLHIGSSQNACPQCTPLASSSPSSNFNL